MESGIPLSTRGQRALAAIVVTDGVGFSARMSVDEETTLNLIHRDLQLMEDLCRQFEGQVLKSVGDGLLLYFVSAVQAVTCALEIQKQLVERACDLPVEKVLKHRIGIHLGDVFFNQSDVMGNGVNIAARLQTEAEPGGICLSQTVYDVVKFRLSLNAAYAGPLHLKNIQEAVPAYRIPPLPIPQRAPLPSPAQPLSEQPQPKRAGSSNSSQLQQREISSGTLVGGRYRIVRLLGQGGFGRSYLVTDTQRFDEECVLKEFVPSSKAGHIVQKAIDLFKREAKTLYQINHPQIPKFLACFTQAKRLFIVQEYINGTTYAQLLRQRQRQGQRFSEAEVVQWLREMLQVLEYLHSLDIVHRDISPDNVMFSRDRGLPVLIDFGLVNDALTRIWSESIDEFSPTQPLGLASMVGKLGYSPPEQLRMGQCYPCSDLYALGVTAIVLLTGKYPTHLVEQSSLEWRWQPYVSVSQSLAQILNTLLKPQPRDRYQSAQEVLEALQALPESDYTSEVLMSEAIAAENLSFSSMAAVSVAVAFPDLGAVSTITASFMTQCRQELARCIGPMASIILEDTLTQYPEITAAGLVEALASQITNPQQAREFKSRITIPRELTSSGAESTQTPAPSSTSPQVQDSLYPARTVVSAAMDDAFLTRCRQELAHCIGPMASFLIEEAIADDPDISHRHLISLLASEIPDVQQAAEFQRRFERV